MGHDGIGDDDDERRELLELEEEFCRAVSSSDVAALARLLADEFTYAHSTGATDDKQQYIGGIERRGRTLTAQDLDVRVYGDTAVVVGTLVTALSSTDGKAPPAPLELRTLQVWIRGAVGWHMVAGAASGRRPT